MIPIPRLPLRSLRQHEREDTHPGEGKRRLMPRHDSLLSLELE